MTSVSPFEIGGRKIGPGHPVYVIAEVSANHHGRYEEAVRLLEAAKESGADAVKLQTYTPDTMTLDADQDCFKVKGTIWAGRRLYDLYREAMTPWEWQPRLKSVAEGLGLHLFSTPFDETAVDFLEAMSVPAHKVASFENGDIPLLEKIGRTRKPVIMSTGMATADEVDEGLAALRAGGAASVALLKCTSAYPASCEDMNLRAIPAMMERFGVPVGLSDHTLGHSAAVAAVALGACLLEKHITLSRSVSGPDSAFSTEPAEFKELVAAVRQTSASLGSAELAPAKGELASRAFRRSLFAVVDIPEGAVLSKENVRVIRPADGLHPRHYAEVLGRRVRRSIRRGTPLDWDLIDRG